MNIQQLSRFKGTGAEHLVCADIWFQGYKAYMMPGGIFDVLLNVENQLIKIQVKGSSNVQRTHNRLVFNTTRGQNMKKFYTNKDIDAWAFVDLIYRKVAYVPIQECTSQYKYTVNRKDFKQRSLKVLLENKIGKKKLDLYHIL